MDEFDKLPKLYRELADWWPVLSSPEYYAEEAEFYHRVIFDASMIPPSTLLELGSGGGNNASHLKAHFQMTLVDLSPQMLAVSQSLNPESEHIQGDMRTVRLGRSFDAVFIHDAIVYMTTEEDLQLAIRTAYEHCKPGGVALFAPDHTLENFKPSTSHGGHDRGSRSMRYLQWSWDPDPTDTIYLSIMVYVLRQGADQVQCIQDRHICGLFHSSFWLKCIQDAGFRGSMLPFEHSEIEPGTCDLFLGWRPV